MKRPYRLAVRTAPSHGADSGSSPDRVTSKFLNRTSFGLGILLLAPVRIDLVLRFARVNLLPTLSEGPFRGVGNSREKFRFRLVKGHYEKDEESECSLF